MTAFLGEKHRSTFLWTDKLNTVHSHEFVVPLSGVLRWCLLLEMMGTNTTDQVFVAFYSETQKHHLETGQRLAIGWFWSHEHFYPAGSRLE